MQLAQRELWECQRLGGTTEETAFEWALLQAASGNVREVESYLQRCADEKPESAPLVWEALAQGYNRIYRTLDAMACLNHWINRHPKDVRALELRGLTYVTGKGVVRGAEDYRSALAIDPARRKTRWRLVGCLIDLGSYEEAAEHLELLARETPTDPEIAARLARCYVMLRRADEGRRVLETALRNHPDDGQCLRSLGQLELAEGRFPEAESALRRAADTLPDDYHANWLLFQALQKQGKHEEARIQLTRTEEVKEFRERIADLTSRKLAEQPLDPALHFEMATLLMRTGQTDIAVQWYLTTLDLDPAHAQAHAALADYFERAGDRNRAMEHRRRAEMLRPARPHPPVTSTFPGSSRSSPGDLSPRN